MPEKAPKNVNDYLREGFTRVAPTGKVADPEGFREMLDRMDQLTEDCYFQDTEIDFRYLMEMAPKPWFDAFDRDRPRMPTEQRMRLQEEADVAIKASYWDQFIDRCITRTLIDFSCQAAPTLLRSLTTRVDAPCSDFTDRKICEFPLDPPPDQCCIHEEDDERARFYNLGQQRCWTMPKPCFHSFAFALHRNLVCVDPNGEVRRMVEDRVRWFDIIDERNLARLFFGIVGGETNCGYPYSYDGTTYASGYLCAGANGPWTNVIEDPELFITGCTESPLCAIEGIFEDMRDPYNCFPLDCPGDLTIMVTKDCKKYPILDLLVGKEIEYYASGEACNPNPKVRRGPRSGWNQQIQMSRWVYDLLVDFYTSGNFEDCDGDPHTYNEAAAAYAAENTYLVSKDFSQTFGFMVDYDISTRELSGTDTWAYFDRGVTWMRRYDRKATPMWMRPWLTLLIRAFDVDDPGGLMPPG